MFCPICKAEYRLGFTRCSECDVDLVEHLEDGSNAPVLEGDPDAMEVLWAGTRTFTRQAIERALKAAKIEYQLDGVASRLMPAFRDQISRIRVRRGDLRAAREAVKKVATEDLDFGRPVSARLDDSSDLLRALGSHRSFMGTGLEETNLPVDAESDEDDEEADSKEALPEPSEGESTSTSAPDDLVEDFYPEDATAEVWSGDDEELAQNLENCLREVGIGCVVLDLQGKWSVRVLPESEARAREIVREIAEGTPPE
jgi:hypothetical protein